METTHVRVRVTKKDVEEYRKERAAAQPWALSSTRAPLARAINRVLRTGLVADYDGMSYTVRAKSDEQPVLDTTGHTFYRSPSQEAKLQHLAATSGRKHVKAIRTTVSLPTECLKRTAKKKQAVANDVLACSGN